MIQTSQELIQAMRNMQTTSARISILNCPEVSDYGHHYSSIDTLLKNEVNDDNYGDLESLNSGITHETGKYAIFEGEGIALNGMQVIDKNNKTNHFGWYSKYLSDKDGKMEEMLNWNFWVLSDEQTNFTIIFSKERQEYAIDFDIIFTLLNYSELDLDPTYITVNVCDNSSVYYTTKIPEWEDYKLEQIEIKIHKWSKPNARAKITSLYFGEMEEFTDSSIVSIKAIKEVDLLNTSFPSKQIDIVLIDEKGEYNIFNLKGNLANLDKNARLIFELGGVIDNFIYYTKIDEYLATELKIEKNSLEISIRGKGRLQYFQEQNFYFNSYEKVPISILEPASEVDSYIRVENRVKKEESLMRTQYGENTSYAEGIGKMATAVRANVVETRDNYVLIKRIIETEPVAYITINQMLDNPEIKKIEKATNIEIKMYYPINKGDMEIFNSRIDLSQEPSYYYFNYNVDHTAPPYKATVTAIGFEQLGEIEVSMRFLDNKAIWGTGLTLENSDAVMVKINGSVIEITSSSVEFNLTKEGKGTRTIDNESIETVLVAEALFQWLVTNYNKEFEYKVEVQDIFTYELGDTVLLDSNIYQQGKMITRPAIITKIETEYKGSLHYILTLRGV